MPELNIPQTNTPALAGRNHCPGATIPMCPRKDTNAMRLNVLFFGRLKDTIGHGQESMEIAVGSSIEDLFVECVARYPELGAHRAAMAVSRNREFAAWTTPLQAG